MIKVNLNLQDTNIDLKTELIDKYLTGVSDKLKNNPCFYGQLYSAISFLTRKLSMSEHIPPIELSISEDGRSFELIGGIRPDPDCMNPALKNNKCFEKISIGLAKDSDDMEITKSSGSLFNFDEYAKSCEGTELGNKLKIMNSHDTPTVLFVMHRNSIFTESGIEVSNSSFSDEYPLGITMNNDNELRTQTSLHSPSKWRFNLLPDEAPFEFNPSRTNAHRFLNSLGIVHVSLSKGRRNEAKSNYADYPADTEYPEVLSTYPNPFMTYENGKPTVTPQYAEYYPGMEEKDVVKEMEINFATGLEGSKTKESNPLAYEALKKIVEENLENKYGIGQKEEGPKMGM